MNTTPSKTIYEKGAKEQKVIYTISFLLLLLVTTTTNKILTYSFYCEIELRKDDRF